VAVVEGYTDVIAAHQAGLTNVVGTMGTAFNDDHVQSLRRLTGCVVLLFDGDEAGQNAADKALVLFLAHELDVRILTLPDRLDPADFLASRGVDTFRNLVAGAADPLQFALDRAAIRFDFGAPEGARQAAEWVLAILARIPKSSAFGLDIKVDKAIDTLADRLGIRERATLDRRLRELRRTVRTVSTSPAATSAQQPEAPPVALKDLNPIDRELVEILLNEPSAAASVITVVAASSLGDAPLRAILQVVYDLYGEGEVPSYDRVTSRLEDPAIKALAAGLMLPIDPLPLPEGMAPAPTAVRLEGLLRTITERQRQERIRELKAARGEIDRQANPDEYEALSQEIIRLLNQRPPEARK
jgi:DNA primase